MPLTAIWAVNVEPMMWFHFRMAGIPMSDVPRPLAVASSVQLFSELKIYPTKPFAAPSANHLPVTPFHFYINSHGSRMMKKLFPTRETGKLVNT